MHIFMKYCVAICLLFNNCCIIANDQSSLQFISYSLNQPNLLLQDSINFSNNFEVNQNVALIEEQRFAKQMEYYPEEYSCDFIKKHSGLELGHVEEIRSTNTTFWVRPSKEFENLNIKLNLDHSMFPLDSKITNEELELNLTELGNNGADQWKKISVEVFKKHKSIGFDRIGIRAFFNGKSKEIITSKWWTVYDVESFMISAHGKATWAFNCKMENPNFTTFNINDAGNFKVLFNVMLIMFTILFIIIIITITMFYCCKIHRKLNNNKDNKRTCVKSFWRGRPNVNSIEDAIYEEFDETPLQNIHRQFAAMGIEGFVSPSRRSNSVVQSQLIQVLPPPRGNILDSPVPLTTVLSSPPAISKNFVPETRRNFVDNQIYDIPSNVECESGSCHPENVNIQVNNVYSLV